MLGVCQYATGQHEQAVANVKLATKLEPEVKLYKKELEDLEKGVELHRKALKGAAEKASDVDL